MNQRRTPAHALVPMPAARDVFVRCRIETIRPSLKRKFSLRAVIREILTHFTT